MQHTMAMLDWWRRHGVDRADVAVRRPSGAMIWHHGLELDSLPLPWARAENVRRAEVYVRPARGGSWPLVFLDDVAVPSAIAVAGKYDSLVVRTSPTGGCHIWLSCGAFLDEIGRRAAQQWLARRLGGDPASISGEHLGRLAGFKNHKRGGCWVNVISATARGHPWRPSSSSAQPSSRLSRQASVTDTSESAKEWGWVCGLLEHGCHPEHVLERLVVHARERRGPDAERYARRTITAAIDHVRRHR